MKIEEKVVLTDCRINISNLNGYVLSLIGGDCDLSSQEKKEDLYEKIKKEFDVMGQYFFDQGRKYEQEKR